MNVRDPIIDPRGHDTLVEQTEELVKAELAAVQLVWNRPSDMASALIHVFTRMAAHVVDNLNRTPNQHFLAFLDMIGAQRTPPRPARAALTFQLAADSDVDAIVPAGTRVAAPPGEGETAEVLFETDRELVVSRARLTAMLVHRPDLDLYADRSPEAPDECPVLEADLPIAHSLLVDGGDVLALPAGTTIEIDFHLPAATPSQWPTLPITWTYWDGDTEKPITLLTSGVEIVGGARRQFATFALTAPIEPRAVDGRLGRWLRATLTTPLLAADAAKVPSIDDIRVSASNAGADIGPDAAFAGNVPLDLTLDFRPFGEQPRIGDAFYVASAIFGKRGAVVTLKFTRSPAALDPAPTDNATIAWEIWTTSGFVEVARSHVHGGGGVNDTTSALTTAGDVTFTVPPNVARLDHGGVSGHWVRARIAQGTKAYGTGVTLTTQPFEIPAQSPGDDPVTIPVIVPVDDGYRPPVIAALALDYAHTVSGPPQTILALNDFEHVNHTSDNTAGFVPFSHGEGDGPALYLGFDPPFANRSASLYFDVAAPLPAETAASTVLATVGGLTAPVFVWEYSSPSGYSRLGAEDETMGLKRSGVVRFVAPADLVKRRELGKEAHWLRARLIRGNFAAAPRLRCVRTNTVWAHQAVLTENEVMGSSGGSPSEVYTLVQTPVLPGQQIEVREPAPPTPAERQAMALAGVRGVEPALDDDGTEKGVWVEWIEVSDFHTSGPRDRHYLLNRMSGAVTFGDGVQGMVPPLGTANIRARSYRAGGGSRGNRPAGTITELKTAVAHVQGVTNTVPSVGGTDLGSEAALKDLGPRVLRHGHVAMTAEDYEDLARAASPDVARARTVTPHFDPIAQDSPTPSLPAGSVLVIIVPFGAEARPAPSLSLLDDVRSHLVARCPPAVSLKVTGPDWVRVTAHVTLAPVSIEASDELVAAARAALDGYLHPLTGGLDGEGWEFGKLPWASDLYPILTAVKGAHHIRRLDLVYEREQPGGTWTAFPTDTPPDAMLRILVFAGNHTIDVYSGDGG